jgi:hypothetical protein
MNTVKNLIKIVKFYFILDLLSKNSKLLKFLVKRLTHCKLMSSDWILKQFKYIYIYIKVINVLYYLNYLSDLAN